MGFWCVFLVLLVVLSIFIFFQAKKLIIKLKRQQVNKFLSNITIDNINSLSGTEFEEFLYYLFLNMGFEVTLTPKSHDYGADLILKIHNKTIVVQSKLYTSHSIGVSSVQEVYSSIKYYNADLGIVVTNSQFSKNSINLANSTNVLLWDKNMLIRLLNFKDYEKKIFRNELLCNMCAIKN